VPVLAVYFCPSSVRVVATFSGTVLFPLLCSVLPFFPLIHWFCSLCNFVIPSKYLKNFICAASKRCSSLFFSHFVWKKNSSFFRDSIPGSSVPQPGHYLVKRTIIVTHIFLNGVLYVLKTEAVLWWWRVPDVPRIFNDFSPFSLSLKAMWRNQIKYRNYATNYSIFTRYSQHVSSNNFGNSSHDISLICDKSVTTQNLPFFELLV